MINFAACDKSDNDHYRSAEHELISADDDGILALREYLNKYRGKCERHSREEDEGVTGKVHIEVKTVKIYRDYSREAYYTRNDLLNGELLLLEDQTGDKDGEEGGRAGDDSSLCARGIGKAYVEEEILDNGLEGGYYCNSS